VTTFLDLKTAVSSEELRDPNNKTFTVSVVGGLINAGIIEVGKIAPEMFQEDIDLLSDTLSYQVRATEFPGGCPELELVRAELWDSSTTPFTYLFRLRPAAGEWSNASAVGWKLWGGKLELPDAFIRVIDPATHLLRVWGYSPYPVLSADDDAFPASTELEYAVRDFCRVQALRRLNMDRDLFTQWQTRSNNTDVSPAGLLNALSVAEDAWRRTERKLHLLREAP
jgi:hypothetical protein